MWACQSHLFDLVTEKALSWMCVSISPLPKWWFIHSQRMAFQHYGWNLGNLLQFILLFNAPVILPPCLSVNSMSQGGCLDSFFFFFFQWESLKGTALSCHAGWRGSITVRSLIKNEGKDCKSTQGRGSLGKPRGLGLEDMEERIFLLF